MIWERTTRPLLSPGFIYGALASPISGPTNPLSAQTYSSGTLTLDNTGALPFAGGGLIFAHPLPAGAVFRMSGDLVAATGDPDWGLELKMGPGNAGLFGVISSTAVPASFDFIAVAPIECPYVYWRLSGASDATIWTIEKFQISLLGNTPMP